jgi:hypothetical protein
MKKYTFILVFFNLVSFTSFAQSNYSKDFNGWEFLRWGLSYTDVEKKLTEANISYTPCTMRSVSPNTKLTYQDMETLLFYDNGLYNVQQYKRFDSLMTKEADDFYNKIKKQLVDTYGEPSQEKDQTTQEAKGFIWNLAYTSVHLVYFYTSPEIQIHFSKTKK